MKKPLQQLISIRLSKRQEFVCITAILTGGLVAVQLVPPELRFWFLFGLTSVSYLLSAVSLREDLKSIEYLTLLVLPTLFTAAVGLFYFLLPVRWLTRLPAAILYAVGIYAILLVENIYNVAVNRSIQLLRVAHVVGFLATLATMFFLFNTIFSFRLHAPINGILVFLVLLPLMVQSLWAIELHDSFQKTLIQYTVIFSLMVAEVAFMISFWPLKPIMSSLLLTILSYALLGIGQHYFAKRLFRQTVLDFTGVFVIVFVVIVLTAHYR